MVIYQQPLVKSNRKIGFVDIIVCLTSVKNIYYGVIQTKF